MLHLIRTPLLRAVSGTGLIANTQVSRRPRKKLISVLLALFLLFLTDCIPSSASDSPSPLYWTIREDAVFSSQWRLNASDGTTVAVLPGRALVAMLEAERRIAAQYGISARLLITNKPGLNAFATEANDRALVVVYADIVPVIGDDVDMWAGLFGHEFAHLYHHHVVAKETRAAVLAIVAAVFNAYEQQKGRNTSDLVNFGETFINNTFSRAQETEADATGVRYMADAGFDPQGAIRLQEMLIAKTGSSGVISFLNTHPSGEARVRNIQQIIASMPPVTGTVSADFSLQDFKQWIVLCSGEEQKSKAMSNGGTTAGGIQHCLLQHNAEFAKRYGLCVADLNSRHAGGGFDALLGCAADAPELHRFTYDVWAQYCSAQSLAEGKVGLMNADPTQRCAWEGDAQMAFRGALCESETLSMGLPSDKRMDRIRACASESSDEVSRFPATNWKLACDRMGSFRASADVDKGRIVQDCLAQGPVASLAQAPVKGTSSPGEVYDAVTLAWTNKALASPSLNPPVTECDRLASREELPGVKRIYLGFIEAPAAEKACIEAINGAQDPSRFQVSLAGVYLQQGRYAEALALAQEAAKRNAVNSNEVQAIIYSYGLGVHRSSEKVIPLLLSEVKRGSVSAIDDLGDALNAGRDVEKAPELAFKLYKLAADNGSALAASDAANAYLAGNGVSVDVPQALQLLKSFGDDYPPALNPLSRALRAMPGSNPAEIRGLLSRLFEQMNHFASLGSLTAKMRLGLLYTNGIGVAVDKDKGFALLTEAAAGGYPPSALWVGYGYLNGTGTPPDKGKAIESFRRAAAAGSPEAEVQLARLSSASN